MNPFTTDITAIFQYNKSIGESHKQWQEENKEKAASSLELAKVLGLIESDGTLVSEHAIIEKWQTRLYLLEYRLKNARPKKNKPAEKQSKTKSDARDRDQDNTKKNSPHQNKKAKTNSKKQKC